MNVCRRLKRHIGFKKYPFLHENSKPDTVDVTKEKNREDSLEPQANMTILVKKITCSGYIFFKIPNKKSIKR